MDVHALLTGANLELGLIAMGGQETGSDRILSDRCMWLCRHMLVALGKRLHSQGCIAVSQVVVADSDFEIEVSSLHTTCEDFIDGLIPLAQQANVQLSKNVTWSLSDNATAITFSQGPLQPVSSQISVTESGSPQGMERRHPEC